MKAYTDLNQSKKLAEILPIESADAYYTVIDQGFFLEVKQGIEPSKEDFPCWSLAALFGVLPKHIGDSVLRMDMSENDFNLWFDDLSGIVDILLPDITKDNPIDACYEMVLKLHEQNFL